MLPTLADIEAAATLVHGVMAPSPQLHWPLLSARLGAEVWVKHENHNPTGAFKVRGGVVYIARLRAERPDIRGIIAATRGNHGQSLAFAAQREGLRCVIVVPQGNSVEKNAAMRAFGAELIEHGHDFQAALEQAQRLAQTERLHFVPSFDRPLIEGVATYALEFFRALPDLDTVYVPIGLGSGICGVVAARDALGVKTCVVGVVAENAPAYALSFEAKRAVSTNSAATFADGVACRVPVDAAVKLIVGGVDRIVRVSEAAIAEAMRHYYTDTHNIAEGAAATPLAAALSESSSRRGRKLGLVLSGGNVDRPVYTRVLAGETP